MLNPRPAQTDRGGAVLSAISVIALSSIMVPVLLLSVLFLLHVSLTPIAMLAGLALGLVSPVFLLGRSREVLIAYGIVVLAVVIAFTVQGRSWDNSHDSLVYHEPAAVAIAQGMNPVYDATGNLWVDHYPKAAWIFSAGVYRLSHNIELSKMLTVLAALACFGVAALFFRALPRIPRWLAYLAAGLVTLSPIVLVQFDTHYVDGLFANMGMLLVLLAVAHRAWGGLRGSASLIDGTIAVLAAVMLANLKFTGLVFVVALLGMHLIATYVNAPRRVWRRGASVLVACVALGILVVGFDPYVTNTVADGNPFYPVFGADLTIVEDAPDKGQRPPAYRTVPAPLAFVMSLADTTRAGSQDEMPSRYRPKLPVVLSRQEVAAMTFPDARTAGFGPLFFLALLLAAVTLVIGALRRDKTDAEDALLHAMLWYGLALLVVLTLCMGEAWWARLAPVFYLSAPYAAVVTLARGNRGSGPAIAAYAVLCVLVANSLVVFAAQAFDYRNRQSVRAEAIAALTTARRVDVRFADSWAEKQQSGSILLRMRSLGIDATLVPYEASDTQGWTELSAVLGEVRAK